MTARRSILPLSFLALTALAACGAEDPFSGKTYTNCIDADSVTFRADGVLTAVVKGETVPEDEFLKFKKISDTEAEIIIPQIETNASAKLMKDGTLLVELPEAGLSSICTPKE